MQTFLGRQEGNIRVVPADRATFEDARRLEDFARASDVIVHLAGVNRHADVDVIETANVQLAQSLVDAVTAAGVSPHIIYSSSSQESRDNPYGRSKKAARLVFEQWAKGSGGRFTAMIIPNVFGPFGKPFYNSVIATFSHQLTHDDTPRIEVDASLKLIYVNNLVERIYDVITGKETSTCIEVKEDGEYTVSGILEKLKYYKESYFDNNIIPNVQTPFELALFNTFRCYIDPDHYPFMLKRNEDNRGHLFEVIKTHDMNEGQVFYSSSHPGITRGNHYHTHKIERFCVLSGEAVIQLRRIDTNEVIEYAVSGDKPSTVDMPIFHTHNITNVGDGELLTLFWTNEIFNPDDPDTFFQPVVQQEETPA